MALPSLVSMPLPPQRTTPVPAAFEPLHRALQGASGIMVRHLMLYRGLQVPANLAVPEINRLAVAYVENGDFPEAYLRVEILNCRENSDKRAYLFTSDPAALATWAPPDPGAVVASREQATLPASNGPERLAYIYRDGQLVRAVFTEQHLIQFVDFDANDFRLVPIQRVIVMTADLLTGDITLMLDRPGKRHPHQNRASAYFAYWRDRAAGFFGATLEPFDLMRALGSLENEQLIRISYTMARTAQGKMALSGIEVEDVRNDPGYADLRQRRIAHDRDEYTWMPQDPIPPANVGLPIRKVKTKIAVSAGELRFMQHAMANEIEYVLAKLRSHG